MRGLTYSGNVPQGPFQQIPTPAVNTSAPPFLLVFVVVTIVAVLLGTASITATEVVGISYIRWYGTEGPYRRATEPVRYWLCMALTGFAFVVCALRAMASSGLIGAASPAAHRRRPSSFRRIVSASCWCNPISTTVRAVPSLTDGCFFAFSSSSSVSTDLPVSAWTRLIPAMNVARRAASVLRLELSVLSQPAAQRSFTDASLFSGRADGLLKANNGCCRRKPHQRPGW
jgi:hypothetical protein